MRSASVSALMENQSQMLDWFEDYNSAGSNIRKQELASRICRRLRTYLAEMDDALLGQLTDEVLDSSPIDELFDSKVRILGDAFAQRVTDEQRDAGAFAQATESDGDMQMLELQIRERLRELNVAEQTLRSL